MSTVSHPTLPPPTYLSTSSHTGIIVPGPATTAAQRLDATNLSLLEATASGIVIRPLLQRMEMTKSRCMIVLPLSPPGEHRLQSNNATTTSATSINSVQLSREYLEQALEKARDKYVTQSQLEHYERHDSLLGIAGALAYAMGLIPTYDPLQPNQKAKSFFAYPGPVSPSAWLVVTLLQEGGAAENVHFRQALQAKVEDFLRDWRFVDTQSIRLRPGWRFLPPMILRAPAATASGSSRRR